MRVHGGGEGPWRGRQSMEGTRVQRGRQSVEGTVRGGDEGPRGGGGDEGPWRGRQNKEGAPPHTYPVLLVQPPARGPQEPIGSQPSDSQRSLLSPRRPPQPLLELAGALPFLKSHCAIPSLHSHGTCRPVEEPGQEGLPGSKWPSGLWVLGERRPSPHLAGWVWVWVPNRCGRPGRRQTWSWGAT